MIRYSNTPFPPYRHRPGFTPHPRRHREGHLYGRVEVAPAPFDPSQWTVSQEYLYGVDLHNFAYYWEAHEAWEGLWKTTERKDLPGRYLQGLIQISAALLKRDLKMEPGMKRLGAAGLRKLGEVAEFHRAYCGLDLPGYRSRIEKIVSHADLDAWPADPRIYLTGLTSQNDKKP